MKKLLILSLVALVGCTGIDYTLTYTKATVVDSGTSYSKFEGTYTYVELVDRSNTTYRLYKVDLDSFPIGRQIAFYKATK